MSMVQGVVRSMVEDGPSHNAAADRLALRIARALDALEPEEGKAKLVSILRGDAELTIDDQDGTLTYWVDDEVLFTISGRSVNRNEDRDHEPQSAQDGGRPAI
jgi:hypothetical protein